MKAKKFLKNVFERFLKTNRRQKLVTVSLAFSAYVLLLVGIFSYLQGKDAVTNKLSAKSGGLTILEPAWDNGGQAMAAASEPGMIIPKNPYGYNDGETELYVRIKMTVELGEYDNTVNGLSGNDTDDGEVGIPNDAKRLEKIVNSIMIGDGDGAEADTNFITLDTSADTVSGWKIASCSNNKFYFDPVNYSGNGADKNSKLVFYFYYTDGDAGQKMVNVRAHASTAELFQYVEIPIYKKDYLGVFDQKYSISLEAEGVPVKGNEGLVADKAADVFDEA